MLLACLVQLNPGIREMTARFSRQGN